MKLLATLCSLLLLLCAEARAQRHLTGRVIDRSTGEGIPGVTVLVKGTTRGIMTTDDGTYALPLLPTDTLGLHVQFSAVGYLSDTRQVLWPDSVLNAGLAVDQKEICTLSIGPSAHLRLWSGLRYAPAGVLASVYARRYLPLNVTLGYQTNLRRNWQWLGELDLPRSYPLYRQQLSATLRYSRIQLAEPAFRFTSYQLRASIRPPSRWLPTVYLGSGYARQARADHHRQGIGYELGLGQYFSRPDIWVQALATRWPGYWQWQGTIRHHFGRAETRLLVNNIGRYTELSLSVGVVLY